jgi:hypothetical protein
MSDRSMRGTRLGAQSLESDTGVQPAARQDVIYHCPNGHTVVVPLSVEAEVPALWECRCGSMALRENHERPDEKPVKPARTHWDMLMERRTTAELEELLQSASPCCAAAVSTADAAPELARFPTRPGPPPAGRPGRLIPRSAPDATPTPRGRREAPCHPPRHGASPMS